MMKSIPIFFAFLGLISIGYGQVPESSGVFLAKEFSKEVSLYRAKEYVMKSILGNHGKVVKFKIEALAAAGSGELTSLVYRCEDLNQEGLVLGFYGNRWNETGVLYQSYAFKHFPAVKAIEMLQIIDSVTSSHNKFLNSDLDENNLYFQYEDVTFLAYYTPVRLMLRVFWKGYDSEWEWTAVARTRKRLLKRLTD